MELALLCQLGRHTKPSCNPQDSPYHCRNLRYLQVQSKGFIKILLNKAIVQGWKCTLLHGWVWILTLLDLQSKPKLQWAAEKYICPRWGLGALQYFKWKHGNYPLLPKNLTIYELVREQKKKQTTRKKGQGVKWLKLCSIFKELNGKIKKREKCKCAIKWDTKYCNSHCFLLGFPTILTSLCQKYKNHIQTLAWISSQDVIKGDK